MEYWLLPTERLAGRSQMNFVALVTHGFSALFFHRDLIGARLLGAKVLRMCVSSGEKAPSVVPPWKLVLSLLPLAAPMH